MINKYISGKKLRLSESHNARTNGRSQRHTHTFRCENVSSFAHFCVQRYKDLMKVMKSLDENLYKTAQNRQSVPFAWHKIKTIQRIIAVPYQGC